MKTKILKFIKMRFVWCKDLSRIFPLSALFIIVLLFISTFYSIHKVKYYERKMAELDRVYDAKYKEFIRKVRLINGYPGMVKRNRKLRKELINLSSPSIQKESKEFDRRKIEYYGDYLNELMKDKRNGFKVKHAKVNMFRYGAYTAENGKKKHHKSIYGDIIHCEEKKKLLVFYNDFFKDRVEVGEGVIPYPQRSFNVEMEATGDWDSIIKLFDKMSPVKREPYILFTVCDVKMKLIKEADLGKRAVYSVKVKMRGYPI